MALSARYAAFQILREMDRKDTFSNIALDRLLAKTRVSDADRHLITELVYGITRYERTLDAIIEQFSRRAAHQQPPVLRRVLQLGLYQLRYLDRIPDSAAVNTTVELARSCGLGSLSKVVNGILRTYLRSPEEKILPPTGDRRVDLAKRYSYPDWMVELWLEWLGDEETEALCQWFNQSPSIDLRVNTTQTSVAELLEQFKAAGIEAEVIADVASGIRLVNHAGAITALPGYDAGLWSVQDASAQQVAFLLDPQPGETVIDCCAAPGGKSTHIAELMGDVGRVWALDRHAGRLKRVKQNSQRLQLQSIDSEAVDLATLELSTDAGAQSLEDQGLPGVGRCDRLLVDAPCSGLGTLHRHADARWRQQPNKITELVQLQAQILKNVADWVKPGGVMVYSTCTTHPDENQHQVDQFLNDHSEWSRDPEHPPVQNWPHRCDHDGFYMARLIKTKG